MSSSSDVEDEERPTWFDGKVEREVWQPSDGNGEARPELIESAKNKKGGHPTWKLFMGDVPAEITPSNPPRYCYLDDKAVWAISKHRKFSREDKHRYWHFDFTPHGMISVARRNRGRPAYLANGSLASIARKKNSPYFFCGSGSLKAPIPPQPAPVPKKEGTAAKGGKTQEPSQTPAPSIEKPVPVADAPRPERPTLKPSEQSAEKPSTKSPAKLAQKPVDKLPEKPSAESLVTPTVKPTVKPTVQSTVQPTVQPSAKPLEEPSQQPSTKPMVTIPMERPEEQGPVRPHKETSKESSAEVLGDKSSTDGNAMALVRLRQMSSMTDNSESPSTPGPRNPSALVPPYFDFSAYTAGTPSKAPHFKDRPKAFTSSPSGSSKRSPSPASPLPPPKRKRSRLEPYVLPPEVTERDDEMERLRAENRRLKGVDLHRQNQMANAVAQMRRKDAMIAQAIKERDAFRLTAREYHTFYLDHLDEFAERHKSNLKIALKRKEMVSMVLEVAGLTTKEVGPLQDLDRKVGQMLEDRARHFRENGMERQWKEFEAEASEQ